MILIKNISKTYQGFSLNNISFSADKGDYVVLLGESGAGKSLILEMIAGTIRPDSGEVWLNDKNITEEKIQNRNIGLVYQDNTIFPHLTVRKNIAFPLRARKQSKEKMERRVQELAQKMGITHLLDRWPETLSGGELQRVALARTLSFEPDGLLLDEPLSSLDVQLRDGMRSLLREINSEGITIIHVSHEFEEAIALANKVGIIHQGQLMQFGEPKEIFHKPKSKFIAHFTGVKNFYHAKIQSNEKLLLENLLEMKHALSIEAGNGFAMFKSEDVVISSQKIDSSITNNFEGFIQDIIPTSQGMELIINIGIKVSASITQSSFDKYQLAKNSKIWIGVKATAIKFVENS